MFKKTTIAAVTIATVATASLSASTDTANAGGRDLVKGLVIGGLIVGGLAQANRHAHGDRYHQRECWYEKRKRWDRYGDPYWVRVKLCN